MSIVNVALPDMRQALGLSVAGQQWVVNAYTLTFAGLLMLGGRAADLFGRRKVFMIGLATFTLFSLIGGLAQSGSWLIAARAAQGVGAAILAPATLSLLTTRFVDPIERRRALGAWSATAASGAAVGVLAGGILTDLLDWRWVLFVNVPIGILLLGAAWVALGESRSPAARPSLDVAGAITVTAGLSALVYGIVSTDTHSWGSLQTITALAVGATLLVAFVIIESRYATHPLVPSASSSSAVCRRPTGSPWPSVPPCSACTFLSLLPPAGRRLQPVTGRPGLSPGRSGHHGRGLGCPGA